MMPQLPERFRTLPLAHRALHDVSDGRPENSRAAVKSAIANGFGIEIDVQLAADNVAMVFHDYDLKRLTGLNGLVREVTSTDLAGIALKGGSEGIPTLAAILEIVAGRVPLLVEIKDQDGSLGVDVGPLEIAVAQVIDDYQGDLGIMSFNPHAVRAMQALAPDVPRGLTTDPFRRTHWSIPTARLKELAEIPDYTSVGACFISHKASDLNNARVAELKEEGATILCWTVRSAAEERKARKVAHNVTFEGYLPERVS